MDSLAKSWCVSRQLAGSLALVLMLVCYLRVFLWSVELCQKHKVEKLHVWCIRKGRGND